MRRTRNILSLAFSLGTVIFLVWACANPGTDTGNPATVGVKVVGIEQEALTKFSKAQSSGDLIVTEARIVLKEIKLEPLAVSCASDEIEPSPEPPDTDFDFPGPFVIDLLSNSSQPEIGTVQTPSGIYCEIEIKFDKLEPGAIPEISADDPLVNHAMLIRGTRGDGTPFLVRLTEDDRFKIEGSRPNGFEITDSNGLDQFFVSLNRTTWFEGVDLNTAEVSGNGSIMLDEANNIVLWTTVVENVKRSTRLFRDLNGDGILNANEIDASLVLGVGVDEED